jgi:hypothetical protein
LTRAIDFEGTNVIMRAPAGRDDVQDVHAFRNRACCVTCWKLDPDAIAEVARTGRVYLSVFMKGGMPPVFVGSESETRQLTADFGGTFPKQDMP